MRKGTAVDVEVLVLWRVSETVPDVSMEETRIPRCCRTGFAR